MLIRLKQKSAELRGKKNALQTGISKAKGELIFTTDADCIVPSKWLRIMVHYFTPDVSMVLGYSPLIRQIKPYFRLLQFDNLFSAIAAAAPAKLGYPFTSVGRNLAYRKIDYETSGGFQALKKFRSGDDIHLTKRFRYHNGGKIDYCAEPETFVQTMIPSTLKEVSTANRKNSKRFMFTTIVYFRCFLVSPVSDISTVPCSVFRRRIIIITIKFILEYLHCGKALIFRQSDLDPDNSLLCKSFIQWLIFFSFIGSFQFYQWKK
jgi:cellulose synthase/poly-beta-1,6-N-acetylglucosamine synthase-like glycosyltransferase